MDMFLESPQNPRVRTWSGLKTKKGRSQEGEFIVEGMRLVEELLDSDLDVSALLWDVGTDELPRHLLAKASARELSPWELSPKAFEAVSDTVTPQGIIAIARLPQSDLPSMPSHVMVLDGVQDPGNVGTLIRSAEAFGFQTMFCGTGTVDPYAPKVVRASMGGLFRLDVFSGDSVDFIQSWKSQWPNGQVVLTTAHADISCKEADLSLPSLVLIGSEAFGVSTAAADLATLPVKIPMSGHTESLNAAIAGSVVMYEVFRQRMDGTH
jgi:RNA methyltransferase, TrmH family